jgi:hypothetical protein
MPTHSVKNFLKMVYMQSIAAQLKIEGKTQNEIQYLVTTLICLNFMKLS